MRGLAALLAITALLYAPGLRGLPTDWDDVLWLADPVRALPAGDALALAFSTTRDGVYAPLLRMAFWLLQAPAALHGASLALFLASIAGLYALLRQLGVSSLVAGVALALWALHPTKVECVAWITGIKDVLSLAFLVGAALSLCDAAPSTRRLAAGTALGVAALLTKAAVFPVPFVVAAIVATRYGRAEAIRRCGPLCAVSLGITLLGAVVWDPHPWPAIPRAVLPLWAHGVFVAKLWPALPAAITPIPTSPVASAALGAIAAVAGLAAARRWPAAAACWFLPLVPFLGLVPMDFWAADRHLLIPSLAPALGLALAAERFAPRWAAVPLALCATFAPFTALRVVEWRDSTTLWEAEVTRPGGHPARWHKLGMARAMAGRFPDAVIAFDRALALDPADRATLARRLIASLAADGWTAADAAMAAALEPAPADDAGWRRAIATLRAGGRPDLAAIAEARLSR